MPVLRRAHDHHRGLRPRLHAPVPAVKRSASLDRHVMMPLLPYPNRNTGRDHRWAWPGPAGARHKRTRGSSKSPPSTPAGGIPAPRFRPVRLPKGLNYPLAPVCWVLAATGDLFKDAMRGTKAALLGLHSGRHGRRVGIRIVTFEACSGFTRVTARRIAQPPKAAFVTRLQPSQLPG